MMLLGDARQRRDHLCRQRPRAADVDVEPVVRGRHLDIKRLSDWCQRLGEYPGCVKCAAQAGIENGAMIDGNDVVRTCRSETHLEHIVRAHPGVQGNPPPAMAMGVDQWMHLTSQLCLCERLDDEIAFPTAIVFRFPVLDRTAPADSKMRAKWCDPLRACTLDRKQTSAIRVVWNACNFDYLSAKRIWYIYVLSVDSRDTVAEMTDVIDDETLNHGARR